MSYCPGEWMDDYLYHSALEEKKEEVEEEKLLEIYDDIQKKVFRKMSISSKEAMCLHHMLEQSDDIAEAFVNVFDLDEIEIRTLENNPTKELLAMIKKKYL